MNKLNTLGNMGASLCAKPFLSLLFIPFCLAQSNDVVAQTGISSAYTTVVANPAGFTYTGGAAPGSATATGTNTKTYFYGNLGGSAVPLARQIQSFQTVNSTFTYTISQNQNINVYIRRQAAPSANIYNVDLLYFEGTINAATTELRTNYPYMPKMEDNFSHRFIGMGTDNLFTNETGFVNNNAIERVDVIVPGGYTIANAAASGMALFERGAANSHDACVVGIVTGIDNNGVPTSYATTFIYVNGTNYNTTQNLYGGDTSDYFVGRRNINTSDNLLVSNITVNQGIGGVYLNLSEFGLSNNQVIYGYSFLPIDFWAATTTGNRAVRAIDWNNATYFPTNTPDISGGIDLSMVAGIVKKMSISGNVYHDANGLENLAVDGTAIRNPGNEQLYVYLVNPSTNNIIAKVAVANDGSFVIDKTIFGTLNMIISTDGSGLEGGTWNNNLKKLPSGWSFSGESFGTNNAAGTGINNGTGTGNNALATAKDGTIAVSFTDQDITNIAFGIQQPPTAKAKDYLVAGSSFSSGAPATFPTLAAYKYISMSSSSLVDINNAANGSLSGTDPEDCTTGNCNGNTGGISSTFIIGTINANTKLYYDFGAGNGGVKEVIANSATATIPNFDINKMVIYAASGAGSAGNEVGFTYAISDKAASTSPFVTYKIATTQPLPVNLISFEVRAHKGQSELYWITSMERSNRGFGIEHSTNSNSWTTIGFLDAPTAKGTTDLQSDYHFVDQQPANGQNFYRLKQTDLNGTFTYSPVRSVWFDQVSGISIYPNPVKDQLTISGLQGEEQIYLLDISGRRIHHTVADQATLHISLAQYSEGVYYLHLINAAGQTLSQKIVKVK